MGRCNIFSDDHLEKAEVIATEGAGTKWRSDLTLMYPAALVQTAIRSSLSPAPTLRDMMLCLRRAVLSKLRITFYRTLLAQQKAHALSAASAKGLVDRTLSSLQCWSSRQCVST